MTEEDAAFILQKAIDNGQAAEVLTCLFDGGGITYDPKSDRVICLSEDILKAALR